VRHVTAPAVRTWRPGTGQRSRAGLLAVRVAGAGEPAIVLLHGLAGSGDVFGAGFDGLAGHGRLVVPDLLGFGRSMDHDRAEFGLEAQLDALQRMAEALGIASGPLALGGHSLGGLLALHWAARRPAAAVRVVTWGAPLYRDDAEAHRHVHALGTMARLFALEGPTSRRACAWMCAHRQAAAWVATLLNPHRPVPIGRQGVLHTWPAYLGGMSGVILRLAWPDAFHALEAAGVPVVLAAGARDPVPVPGRAAELAARHANVRVVRHPSADHDLPLIDPGWCARQLTPLSGGTG
jgi:pimeloyl-ACP methyl ester carboxylesterase